MFVVSETQATQIVIVNMDSPGEGFNDNTPAVPVGGNTGLTIGQQRLQVFEFVARIWESVIDSNVIIRVEAKFDPLICSTSSAVLGSAGPTTVQRDFTNAPFSNTYYSIAHANSLAGSDLSSLADISATFNADIDNNSACLGNYNWYYGLDGVKPSSTVEMLTVVLHEIGHGLGFMTFVNINTGAKFGRPGRDDAYMLNLEDHSLNKNWNELTNSQRQASIIDTADLHWTGQAVTSKLSEFSAGINQGHIRMFAPSPVQGGSSVSHFSNAVAPNELMEPVDTGPKEGAGLAKELFQDIGWSTFNNFKPVISQISDVVYSSLSNQINFIIRDTDNVLSSLNIIVSSSDMSVINDSGLVISGTDNMRTLTLTPQSSGVSTISITVSDEFDSVVESFQLTVLNTKPVVIINSPVDDANFANGSDLIFQAIATDIEDGDMSPSIVWDSSINGNLGTGGVINSSLSSGIHIISANITDSLSSNATSSITVNMLGDTDADGMNDAWELNVFGSLTRDGAGDFDSDGISDLDEYLISIALPDGDLNLDGNVNVQDLIVAQKILRGSLLITPLQLAHADVAPLVNGVPVPDGQFGVADMIVLRRKAMGDISY